jgi:hypothetical protein
MSLHLSAPCFRTPCVYVRGVGVPIRSPHELDALDRWTQSVLDNVARRVPNPGAPVDYVVVTDASAWGWGALVYDASSGCVRVHQHEWDDAFTGRHSRRVLNRRVLGGWSGGPKLSFQPSLAMDLNKNHGHHGRPTASTSVAHFRALPSGPNGADGVLGPQDPTSKYPQAQA